MSCLNVMEQDLPASGPAGGAVAAGDGVVWGAGGPVRGWVAIVSAPIAAGVFPIKREIRA